MFLTYCLVTVSIVGAYVYLIISIMEKWSELPGHQITDEAIGYPSVSFIIPARNEAKYIGKCIDHLIIQSDRFPGIVKEIIIVDDHSEDDTVEIVQTKLYPSLQLLYLKDHLVGPRESYNAFKKLALNLGLAHATGDYIIQMDADTYCGPDYLEVVLSTLGQGEFDMVAAPVCFDSEGGSAFQDFQALDFVGMMALTAVGIDSGHWHLSNGANLIYRRGIVSFEDSGYASGDDIFAIQKVARDSKDNITFLKDKRAIVRTPAETTLSGFISQRLRWATKNKGLKEKGLWVIMATPYIMVMWFLVHFVGYFFFGPITLVMALMQLMAKMGIDYLYLKELSIYFEIEAAMKNFWYCSLAHILYIGIIGTMSFFVRRYNWKGRRVS